MPIAVESPTNCWTSAQDKIMTALSESAAFQSLVEAADSADALTKIFGQQLFSPDDGHAFTKDELASLNYAQVYSAEQNPYGFRSPGLGRKLKSGTAIVYLERRVTEYDANNQAEPLGIERWLENRVGDLMDEVFDYMAAFSGPFVKTFFVSDGPGTNDRKDWDAIGMRQGVELLMEWGYE